MKNNKLIAINDYQKLMSQSVANTKIDPLNCTEIELKVFYQELGTLIVKYIEDREDEKDLYIDKINRLQ
jgi:hypothetical protein